MSTDNNGPEKSLRDGHLQASIWRRPGKDRDFFTTSFSKSYPDAEGNLKNTNSFGEQDLLGISELARQAHNEVKDLRREAFQNRRQSAPQQNRARSR